MCFGRQALWMIAPRIGAGLDGEEAVAAFVIGQAAAGAEEIRIERRGMLVDLVNITSGGVRLPDLDQRIAHRPAVFVEHAARHDDAFAERLAVLCGVAREVVVEFAEIFRAIYRHAPVSQVLF